MRFAAIADIHGNSDALAAVLADIAALDIDDVVNLGDHLSGPLEPVRTADMLMARSFPSVRGDQDRHMIDLHRAGDLSRRDVRALRQEHVAWLAAQPATLLYRDEVFMCHAAPDDDAAFWLEDILADGTPRPNALASIETRAAGIDASLILCGHSHIPRLIRLGDGRLIVNPGSVGLPGYRLATPKRYHVEAGTPDACYAIAERRLEQWSVTFRYVPYDPAAMAALARQGGRPDWANAIATGWVA
ncbi:DNA methylase [Bradyrhizobium sp. SSBR45G]|uniref:metallophosphoesterase family protein n=1 Tax=unclassified Bradyrhizobium TaxID=2631580 RepID=UPI0023428FDE|nr:MULTISPECIES: metallophosphoesterase family protein [unclassified Bradyrhizobium]GLH76165.1 DNA methylase [Bradyrhizobium sp. SSBR45G]GLH83351.1 DNA methylase [Bradyrhizobium sp. SSBR45R]